MTDRKDSKRIDKKNIEDTLQKVLMATRSLIIYRELQELPAWQHFMGLLSGILDKNITPSDLVEAYYSFLNAFINSCYSIDSSYYSWKEWLLDRVLYSENIFTIWAENQKGALPKAMLEGANHDLDCISQIANIPWDELIFLLEDKIEGQKLLNIFENDGDKTWEEVCYGRGLEDWNIKSLIKYYNQKGSGIFSIYNGFYWNGTSLECIKETDPITLNQLLGYDVQKQILLDNTEKFVSGYSANNVLLYGDKGTGKSSMVKALIHEFSHRGLRMIELPKIHLGDYHKILEHIEDRKFKFIIFIDDLSFEEHEVEYKHIKALLEGGLKARPSNVLVYATSNRRHLVRELASDRSSTGYQYNDRNEISPTDTMQEKLSLADRFGITLTFIAPNQKGYLEMIEAMAKERGLNIGRELLHEKALTWEKRYNGRSGRTAKQFIDDLEGYLRS